MYDPTPLYDAIDPDEPLEEAAFITTLVDGIEAGHVYPWRLYDSGDKKRRLSHAAFEALGKVLRRLNNSDLCYRKYKLNDVRDRVEDGKKAFKEYEMNRLREEEESRKRGVEESRKEEPRKRVRFELGQSSRANETSSDSEEGSESEYSDSEPSGSDIEPLVIADEDGLVFLRGADVIDAYEREQFAGSKPTVPIVISDDEGERRQEVEGVEVMGEDLVEIEGRKVKGKGKVPVHYVQPVGEVGGHPLVDVEEGRRVVVCGLLFDPAGWEKLRTPKKPRREAKLPPMPPRRSLRRRVIKSEPAETGGSPRLVESVTVVVSLFPFVVNFYAVPDPEVGNVYCFFMMLACVGYYDVGNFVVGWFLRIMLVLCCKFL